MLIKKITSFINYVSMYMEKARSSHILTLLRRKKARVSDEFKAIFTAFSILDNLSLYSNKLGIKILNKTHDSYLDMFDR